VAQTMYAHVSKCKNDKIKKNVKKKRLWLLYMLLYPLIVKKIL
jgi:hypothetical protein